MKNTSGFTLIELMVVITIIGILAAISIPQYERYIVRSEVTEALGMGAYAKERINRYYRENLDFPRDNAQAGLPAPDKLIGNRTSKVVVESGAVHVTLGNKASSQLQKKILSFRPAVVDGSPQSPISWLCGNDIPVKGMTAVGKNKTDLPAEYLPNSCRKRDS